MGMSERQIEIDFEEKRDLETEISNIKIDNDKKGLFTFTGNPIIDNGIAVLANIANKDNFEDITPQNILENLDSFFEKIKDKFNDVNASKDEKKYSKKKLKQHLILLYTPNHYLHGINNKIIKSFVVKIIFDNNDIDALPKFLNDFEKKISKNKTSFIKEIIIDNSTKSKEFYEKKYTEKLKSEEVIGDFNFEIKIVDKKTSVETNDEYFTTFKSEVEKNLKLTSKTMNDKRRIEKNNICNFCGKSSDISLSKDIFPLTSALNDFNLGIVHICRYCYLTSLFSFFNFINFKTEEALKKGKSGMYFFYHFSNSQVMIEYSKHQIQKLQKEKLASLQTIIGGQYSSVFNDLYEKINFLPTLKKSNSSVVIYFLLNHNEGAFYQNLTLPNGLFRFWYFLNSPNYQNEWSKIHSKLIHKKDYQDFISGNLNIRKYKDENKMPILKKETIKSYLMEVALMNEELIKICETLASKLVNYFKKIHERNAKRRENWTEDFFDFFNHKKSFELFNNLFSMNNDYFRWTEGENLISVSSSKILLDNFKKSNMLYGLIEFFILNSFEEDEKKQYFNYVNKKENK